VQREGRAALIVDYDRRTCELISRLLQERGYETAVATTYASGLSLFEATGPRVLVIDPRLSDGDGLELVRKALPSTRVVLTSAFPTGFAGAAAALGVPLVAKPFVVDELVALIG
jgi:DNA-binding response OmpR family regulator